MRLLILVSLLLGTQWLEAKQPNILFVLTDDQGWSSLSAYGSQRVQTPHLDQLAAEGMRFTHAYALPQCTPTRAGFLTGQHAARNGMWHVIGWYGTPWAPVAEPAFKENFKREQFNLAKGLKKAGYQTGIIGKWHLTTNADGHYVGLKPEAAHHYGFDFSAQSPDPRYHQSPDKGVDWMTDEALAFAKRHPDKPWFCYLSHHTLHGPVLAPPALVEKHRRKGAPEKGLHNATYLAAIEHLDQSMGRLLEGLERLGQKDNTIVIFFCDNGGVYQQYDIAPFKEGPGTATRLKVAKEEFSNTPLRAGKGSQYEGGIREPLIIRWPGVVPPGSVENTSVHVIDFLPTLLSCAGTQAPTDYPVDGVDLTPILRGGSIEARPLFWYLPLYDLRWGATPCAIIQRDKWKLIEYFGDRIDAQGRYQRGHHLELFNLKTDLAESANRAKLEPEKTRTLQRELHQLIRQCGATIPGPNPHYDPSRPLKETKQKPSFVRPYAPRL